MHTLKRPYILFRLLGGLIGRVEPHHFWLNIMISSAYIGVSHDVLQPVELLSDDTLSISHYSSTFVEDVQQDKSPYRFLKLYLTPTLIIYLNKPNEFLNLFDCLLRKEGCEVLPVYNYRLKTTLLGEVFIV